MRANHIITQEIGGHIAVYTGVSGHWWSQDEHDATHMHRAQARQVVADLGRAWNADTLHVVEVVR